MILTGILVTVAAAWVLDAVSDAPTAGTIAMGVGREAAAFIESRLAVVTVVGVLSAAVMMAVAIGTRERLMGSGVADRIALAGIGALLLVTGAWMIVHNSPVGAIVFMAAGAGMLIVGARWVVRYLRFSAQQM